MARSLTVVGRHLDFDPEYLLPPDARTGVRHRIAAAEYDEIADTTTYRLAAVTADEFREHVETSLMPQAVARRRIGGLFNA